MDLNGDGSISSDEWQGSEDVFTQFDENGDGSLSEEELAVLPIHGKRPSFDKMDTNDDGLISSDEGFFYRLIIKQKLISWVNRSERLEMRKLIKLHHHPITVKIYDFFNPSCYKSSY